MNIVETIQVNLKHSIDVDGVQEDSFRKSDASVQVIRHRGDYMSVILKDDREIRIPDHNIAAYVKGDDE